MYSSFLFDLFLLCTKICKYKKQKQIYNTLNIMLRRVNFDPNYSKTRFEMNFLILAAGVFILYFFAELLVKGASRLAASYNIRPIIIGVTIVAFGTSFPELVVSLLSALQGSTDIAIGNIVGSNIANIGLILGIAAFILPLQVHMRLFKVEVPLLVVSTLFLFYLSSNGILTRINALFFLIIFAGFIIYSIKDAGIEEDEVQEEFKKELADGNKRYINIVRIVLGLTGIGLGAQMIVMSATTIARAFGISEVVIGVSIVAIGTSLPELATSVVAAIKKEPDISIGNIIGSNLFNILFILGTVGLISPIGISNKFFLVHIPVMLLFTIIVIPIMRVGFIIRRVEGLFLMILYLGYLTYLVISK